jgi:PKD repeat protein
MAVTKGLIWTGITNSDFTNPGNYLGGDATSLTGPSTNSTVIIPVVSSNTYPIVTGTQTCHGLEFVSTYSNQNPNITISTGSELRLQASSTYKSFINRSGFASSPKIEGTGTLRFNEGGINSGEVLCPVRFYGVVAVRSGVNVISNGNMRFENNSVLLCGGVATTVPTKNYSGTVSGNIVYVRTGTVYAGYNYWSSPINSANTDLLLSNYGNNIYEYNNQNPGSVTNTLLGWSAITTGTTSIPGSGVTMTPGKGYIQTFAGNGSVTFTGTPNQTSVSIPTTVNGTNNFNLLGNPYPAALSYDAFKASNPSLGSVYLWSNVGATIPYTTSSYVVMSSLGLSGNSVSGFTAKEIGPTQGFLTNVSSAGNINFSPNHVVPNYPGNTTQFLENNPLSLIRLRLTNPNQISFDILVGFGDTGTEGVDFGYDSPRMPSSEILELFTLIGEQQYSSQFLPNLTSTRVVNLGTVMSEAGTHTFDLTGFDNFDSSVRVYLEDVLTGELHNMNLISSYSFTNDPSFSGTRFRLHFMAPIAVSVTGTCLDQSTGKMIINNPNDQNPITTTLRNDQGVVVGSSSPFVGEHVFQNLPSGSYGVDLTLNQNDVVTQYVNVDGGGIITPATFVSSATEVSIVDAIIEFSAQAQGASEFTWNFGDGVILSGTATPVHTYTQPGIYTVMLTASNGICESTVSSIIIVTNNPTSIKDVSGTNGFSIYPNPANDQLNIVKLNNDKVLFEMNDVSGKCVLRSQLNSKLNNINISHLDSGVYTGSMIQNGIRKTIRIVIVH